MKITTQKQYDSALEEVNSIMKKGESKVSVEELQILQKLTLQIEDYESEVYLFPIPKTIVEMVEMKMFENKLSQTDLSKKTKIPLPKLNQILKGKRKPDIDFLKGIYHVLNIPADFILSKV